MRKTVKKIAALVAGTTMVGATIMGAMALDLSNYPAPFVTDGVFDGKIVVGAKAATSDVVGAIDIAASLQAAATTTNEIDIPGAAGKATVTGDAAEFKTQSNILSLNGEMLGDVKSTFTADDLNALKSGVLDTGLGSTPVKQYLKFADPLADTTSYVTYGLNDDDVLADFLVFPDGAPYFEYHMEFTEGADSEIGTGGALDDFENEVINILGAPFTIVLADQAAGDSLQLDLLGGQVADTLKDGETKTYTIDGKDYEVTAVFIDSDSQTVKLSVNGMLTKELSEGGTQVLGSDVTVGVQDIMTNQREGLAEFYLGANKISFKDANYADAVYDGDGTIKVGTKTLSDADLIMKAANNTANDELTLSYIKYKVSADDDIYVPAGKGLKEFISEDEAMLTSTWDIIYTGLMQTGTTTVKLAPVSDHSYKLEFENVNGAKYSIPFLSNKDDDFVWGQDATKGRLVFVENVNGTDYQANESTFIRQKDFFVVTDKDTDATTVDDAVVNVLKYTSIQTSTKIVNFEDQAGGTIAVSYVGDPGDDAEGELIVAGASHAFYVGDDNGDENEQYALSIDLDGDGMVNTDEVFIVTKGGYIIDLGTQTFTSGSGAVVALDGTEVQMGFTTPQASFDDNVAAEASQVNVSEVVDEAITAAIVVPDTNTDDVNDKYARGMTDFGALWEKFTPDTGAPTVKVDYPLSQRGAQVFVTAGTVEVKSGTSTAGGTLESTTLNPIAVGLAVLDTDAMSLIGKTNLIVVGGPCANTVAMSLMGNPVDCAAGFTPGKAIIKLFSAQNALLVAGYEAQETLGASYVLAEYKDYPNLKGTEVEVVVADLKNIVVNALV